jgi:signal transduction histidine kinase
MTARLTPLLHAASAIVLGTVWFSALVTLWATGLGLLVTLLGLPVIWATLVASGWMARVEVALARRWLGADARPPAQHRGWALVPRLKDPSIWRAQGYLLLRFVLGLALGAVLVGLVVQGIGLIVAPAWFWAPPDGIDLGLFDVDRLWEAFAVIPLGVLCVALGVWLAGPYGALWRRLAERLLDGGGAGGGMPGTQRFHARTPVLASHLVVGVCILVWAFTGEGSFWPAWVAVGMVAFAGTAVAVEHRSKLIFDGVVVAVCFAVWALAGGGYLWPVWPVLGLAVANGVRAIAARSGRIQQLTRTRADVVGAQEDELRRIERDLHDGAQARLVSLSMSLGLAEARLDEDPERARELVAEAQGQARTAIKELRDLARGIAPPVLQDRGLVAAIEALTATAPLPVEVTGNLTGRPPASIERAGYFVAAEAVANAIKHAGAAHLRVTVDRFADELTVVVQDDGRGGADRNGSGLDGLRRRVEAVDGRLDVVSLAGRGTTVRASLPCGSS